MNRDDLPRFYSYSLYSQKNKHINLLQVGMHKCDPGYSYSHYRDMYNIHIVKSGIATVETGGHRYTLTKNDVYLVRPYELTVQTSDTEHPCELYFFAFNGELSEELISKSVFKNNTIFTSLKDESIFERIPKIAFLLNQKSSRNIYTYRYLFELLSYFNSSDEYLLPQKK